MRIIVVVDVLPILWQGLGKVSGNALSAAFTRLGKSRPITQTN